MAKRHNLPVEVELVVNESLMGKIAKRARLENLTPQQWALKVVMLEVGYIDDQPKQPTPVESASETVSE